MIDPVRLKSVADEILDGMPEDGRPVADRTEEAVSLARAALGGDSEHETNIETVVDTFQSLLYLPDPGVVHVTLGSVAANLLPGEPVWTLNVAPAGSGKTEVVQATGGLPNVYSAATLTEAALLSGTPGKDKAKGAKGGLLREIGDFGIIIFKDFGSILSMHRDARAAVLAALREIYDGEWTRYVGADGGKTLHWRGKIGFIGGCTPTIDNHHAVMAAMGERFLLYRLPEVDADEQAEGALNQDGHEGEMRAALSEAVTRVFEGGLRTPRPLTEGERSRLKFLATFVVRARSTVERDGYSREIQLVPGAELPARLVKMLARLLAGMDAIGIERSMAWGVTTKAALDCIPAIRRSALALLHAHGDDMEATAIAAELDYPRNTAIRALEDLTAHGMLKRTPYGKGNAHTWRLTEWAAERFEAISPETSEPLITPDTTFDDFSGEIEPEGGADG